jgi:GTPase SAR1 family protein
MNQSTIIVLLGCDGVGKSLLCNKINEYYTNTQLSLSMDDKIFSNPVYCCERSMTKWVNQTHENLYKLIKLSEQNIATLQDVWNTDRYVFQNCVTWEGVQYAIHYYVITCSLNILIDRINQRKVNDKWETKRALEYYVNRFRELSSYYGFPLIDNSNTIVSTISQIITIDTEYEKINKFAMKTIKRSTLKFYDVEYILAMYLLTNPQIMLEILEEFKFMDELQELQDFWISIVQNDNKDSLVKILARYLVNQHMIVDPLYIKFSYGNKNLSIVNNGYIKLITEGESKKIYKILGNNEYFDSCVIIMLKSTIYSHSKQATGVIETLGNIRGHGTQLYLEMMWRNGMKHCYRCVNLEGIILSDHLDSIPPTEIVGKFNCAGTDKHSYYSMINDGDIVNTNGEYVNGLYIRTDWRNPNHVFVSSGKATTENKYYYVMEEIFGNEMFFEKFLKNQNFVKPIGDKIVFPNLITNKLNLHSTTTNVVKIMYTIKAYLNDIGLDVIDACFMLDKSGEVFWSEINQDCMRIQSLDNSVDTYDKDIWRVGGSSAKENIVAKWKLFNNKLRQYFEERPFHLTDIFTYYEYKYEKYVCQILQDSLSNNKLSSYYRNIYSGLINKNNLKRVLIDLDFTPSVWTDMLILSKFPDVMISSVDQNYDKQIIHQITKKYYNYNNFPLNSLTDALDLLANSTRRIIVEHGRHDIINVLSQKRMIIDCRKLVLNNPDIINYEAILINKQQIREFNPNDNSCINLFEICKDVKKIYVYVENLSDIDFMIRFNRVIPIIKANTSSHIELLSDILSKIINMDKDNTIPVILQSSGGNVIDYLNVTKEKLLQRGLLSNPCVIKISPNENANSILVTMNTTNFVEKFNTQTIVKANILTLENNISKINKESNSEILLTKILDGFHKMANMDIEDATQFLSDYISYIKSKGIEIENVMNTMNALRWKVTLDPLNVVKPQSYYKIGITSSKYANKTDEFILDKFGVKIIRTNTRALKLNYEIVDNEKYSQYWDKPIYWVPMRPKDMGYSMASNDIDGAVTYNSVLDNQPNIGKLITHTPCPTLQLCLIKRTNETVSFPTTKKIAVEHYTYVDKYLRNTGVDVEMKHVLGSSESYLVCDPDNFILCDAIVESCATINDNNLEIYKIIKEKGELFIGLYMK